MIILQMKLIQNSCKGVKLYLSTRRSNTSAFFLQKKSPLFISQARLLLKHQKNFGGKTMKTLMTCSEKEVRKYGIAVEEKHEYEICRFSSKNIYSYAQSQQVIRSLKHCKTRNHNKVYLRAYKCKRCNGWHLTSEKTFQYREERQVTYENKRVC